MAAKPFSNREWSPRLPADRFISLKIPDPRPWSLWATVRDLLKKFSTSTTNYGRTSRRFRETRWNGFDTAERRHKSRIRKVLAACRSEADTAQRGEPKKPRLRLP